MEYFAVSEKILNFVAEFIHHLTEGNQRTLGQDALRPLLFLIGHKKRIPAKACHRNSLFKMIHHISLKYGAFWFMDKNLFSNEAIFQKCQSHIQEELKRTKEEFILEHYKKYSDPDMPPVWKTLEVITFGTLSKLYCNLKDNSIKKKIAKEFYLPQHIILENWIKCAVVLRNYLVHHARLWNRNFPIIPQTSKPFRKKWLNHQIPVTNKLYPHLCCLQYFLNSIKEDNFFKERLKVLIANHPNVDIAAMGFPADWEKEPLWEGRANGLVLLSPL